MSTLSLQRMTWSDMVYSGNLITAAIEKQHFTNYYYVKHII